jgi:hypothetical protein
MAKVKEGGKMIQELAYRESDGIEIALLWSTVEDQVFVRVSDARASECFEVAVASDKALDAFYHPFVYATA